MKPDKYHKVAHLAELPQGETLYVELEEREILLCHTTEGIFAVDNLCSHAHARLCDGKLRGHKILCPLHGASFDVRDGSALSRPAVTPIASHAVKLENETIFVAMAD